MKLILRRIRGALGMSAMWALLWAALSPIGALLIRMENGHYFVPSFHFLLFHALTWATSGAFGGLVFGLCLATDARPTLRQLSVRRAAMWGGVSAVLLPFAFEIGGRLLTNRPLFWFHAQLLAEFAAAGIVSGATVVALARSRARKDTPELDISAMRELSGSVWANASAERSREELYTSTSF